MSLVIVVIYKFFLHTLSWPVYVIIFMVLFFTGVLASHHYSALLGEKDPKSTVIDEACGQLLVLFLVQSTWVVLFLGFFLFRFFDIIKPYPVRRAENLRKGWGIMVDDIVAGVYSAIILNVYLVLR